LLDDSLPDSKTESRFRQARGRRFLRKPKNPKQRPAGIEVAEELRARISKEKEAMRKFCVLLTAVMAVLSSRGVSEAQPLSAIKLFNGTPVTESAPCVNPLACSPVIDRVVYDEATLLLSCRSRPTAVLSSTPNGRGAFVVDNFVEVNGRNVCTGGVATIDGVQMCYNLPFVGTIGTPALEATQPVSPIDISSSMPVHGRAPMMFDLVDYGGLYFNSDVWLVTDCKVHQKAAICHKPGTPAEKILSVGTAAIAGHLRHGDTLDLSACRR
jgi:hypothetical protein